MKLPEPYWQSPDGAHTLYCADCMDILPLLEPGSVDAVMTSPPYNTLPQSSKPGGLHGERITGVNQWMNRAVNGYFDYRPEAEYQSWLVSILTECVRVSAGLVWVNHKIRYRDGEAIHPARIFPWPIYSEIVWDRRGSMALNCKRFAPSFEGLWAFGKPVVWNDHLNALLSVWPLRYDRDENDHPCAYPVMIAERPIEASTPERGTVLDPFVGSGTTAVACIRTGRRSISIEKEEKYCAIAKRRMENAIGVGTLFDPKTLAQPDLFK